MKRPVYLAGSIAKDPNYRVKFVRAEAALRKKGYNVLNQALLPEGLTRAEYMRICISMIDVAAAVFALPDAGESAGAQVELAYCRYIGKPVVELEEDRA